jgi:Flp pilus assembly protein TadD
MATNHYTVLGVAQTASEAEIRRRFKALARERHPDRFRGPEKETAEREFQELTQAFNVLTDATRRRQYDQELGKVAASAPSEAPTGQSPPAELARAYLVRGVEGYKKGDYMGAAKAFDEATRLAPDNPQAWHNLAMALSRDERWLRRASAAVAKAVELEPMKPSYLKLAGKIHARLGNRDQAVAAYRQALSWGGSDEAIETALAELETGKKSRLGFFGKN